MTILCADPLAQYRSHKHEIDEAVARVLRGGRYVLGAEVTAFEDEFAEFCGASFAVGVGSGTDALLLALVAAGVGRDDEVITVSHTAVATVAAIEQAQAVPVLVDIEADTFTIDASLAAAAITPRTKAIIAVHLYGYPADLIGLRALADRHGIALIEDCAQAHGATQGGRTVGGVGDLAAFSFYPTKNLGAIGDGGAVVTSNPTFAARVRTLREYGWTERFVSSVSGWNSRLDELQAAILRVKLPHLSADNDTRRRIAELYDSELVRTRLIRPPLARNAVFHLYVVRSSERDRLMSHLASREIIAGIHYPVPIHRQPAYRTGSVRVAGSMTNSERAASEVLSLPMYPELTRDDMMRVAAAIYEFEELVQ